MWIFRRFSIRDDLSQVCTRLLSCMQEMPAKTQEWIDEHARGCPVCGVAIQKNGGCDHMNCANCGAKFGWTHRWHGRVAAPRPTAGATTKPRGTERSGGGSGSGGTAVPSVSAEDLVRAQDRDALQMLLGRALERRENLEREKLVRCLLHRISLSLPCHSSDRHAIKRLFCRRIFQRTRIKPTGHYYIEIFAVPARKTNPTGSSRAA